MGENDNLRVQQEINTNMSVASQAPFAMSNEEQAFSPQQQRRGAFNRSGRRKTEQQKIEQQIDTQHWVNRSGADNNLHIGTNGNVRVTQEWAHHPSLNQEVLSSDQNNRASSESIDTIRENIKNSRESLKRRSCESLTIEEASMRSRSASSGSHGQLDVKTVENKCDVDSGNAGSEKHSANNTAVIGGLNCNSHKVNDKQSIEGCNRNTENEEVRNKENGKTVTEHNKNTVNEKTKGESNLSYQDTSSNRRACRESTDSLSESTYDLSRSYRSISMSDPYTEAIDLSNKCRQFYFNHLKSAEAIKKSVRSAKHTRAKEKMEGKPSSGIDNAMDRLRSEMADLMDQDLSLMSQLLKLNDKIEEVKTHVAYRQSRESYGSQSSCYSEMSDSEFEDNDDSRLDLSQSARNFKVQTMKTITESKPQDEVVLRRLEPTDSQIIVYKKKKGRRDKRRDKSKVSQSRSETEEETTDESDENGGASDSLSDTESTLSYNSGSTVDGSEQSEDAEQSSDVADSGIQSPKPDEEPPTPKKGGISQNRKFLSFHKKNGNITKSVLTGLNVMTMQGHNVPLDKYYVPPGLVYLKQEKSENVFCQFTK